ncbi:MAG TPA: nitroreductase/quinone reductase family protein [Solirubrobacteraceae bacterium]|nr:nitroreductase/quinone reductase family protein [Solirubrobacteraceae bacterium]
MTTAAAEYNGRVIGEFHANEVADTATGEERERLFVLAARRFPQPAEYAQRTDRAITVLVLTSLCAA